MRDRPALPLQPRLHPPLCTEGPVAVPDTAELCVGEAHPGLNCT